MLNNINDNIFHPYASYLKTNYAINTNNISYNNNLHDNYGNNCFK